MSLASYHCSTPRPRMSRPPGQWVSTTKEGSSSISIIASVSRGSLTASTSAPHAAFPAFLIVSGPLPLRWWVPGIGCHGLLAEGDSRRHGLERGIGNCRHRQLGDYIAFPQNEIERTQIGDFQYHLACPTRVNGWCRHVNHEAGTGACTLAVDKGNKVRPVDWRANLL